MLLLTVVAASFHHDDDRGRPTSIVMQALMKLSLAQFQRRITKMRCKQMMDCNSHHQQAQSPNPASRTWFGTLTDNDGSFPNRRTPRILECHGDYRSEARVVEDPSLPLYAHQFSLPPLPVPTLEETMQTFLPTALPFATCPQQVQDLQEACKRFPAQAAVLQERLLQRQRDTFANSSWLQQWWNQLQYLQYREPLFHVSYFYRLDDDPSCHRGDGLNRAASVLQATAIYAHRILSGQRPPDAGGGTRGPTSAIDAPSTTTTTTYLCSTQYKYLFQTCRIPRPHCDSVRLHDPGSVTMPSHAIVVCNGQFYKIPLVHPPSDNCHQHNPERLLHVDTLRSLLHDCVRQSSSRRGVDVDVDVDGTVLPELGWLTATHRDTWSKVYESNFLKDPALQAAMHDLQSALCVLALDWDDDNDNEEDEIETPTATMLRLWHGNHTQSFNRWYDKSFQLVVNRRGQLGYIGEHSMADGMPAMALCQYLMDHGRIEHGNHPDASTEVLPVVESPTIDNPSSSSTLDALRAIPLFQQPFLQLEEPVKQAIQECVEQARREVTNRISQHELSVLTYNNYGSTRLKQAKVSPDAWAQLAIQIAGHDVFGTVVGTYEATHTRRFLHGRTETTRSVNPESQTFVQVMKDPLATLDEKRTALHMAIEAHTRYIRKASHGRGVDRHFWGLQLLLREGEVAPDLFSNPLYQVSQTWKLSTSTVPRARTGFANVETDGLGVGYDMQAHECIFTITGRVEHNLVHPMDAALRQALDDMNELLLSQDAGDWQATTSHARSRL